MHYRYLSAKVIIQYKWGESSQMNKMLTSIYSLQDSLPMVFSQYFYPFIPCIYVYLLNNNCLVRSNGSKNISLIKCIGDLLLID
jgi:hypothetical protein